MPGTLTCPTCSRVYANTLAACPFCAVGAGPAAAPVAGPIRVDSGRAMRTGPTSGKQLLVIGGVLGVIMLLTGVISAFVGVIGLWPPVRVVNVSGSPITVTVDGKTKLKDVDSIKGETSDAVRKFRLSTGSHVIEAIGPDGKVLDHETVDIKWSGTYLFSPKHGDTCFEVVTSVYGEDASPEEPTWLNPRQTFWKIDHGVDRWLEDSPDSMEVDVGSTARDTAVRERDCSE